MSKQTKIAIWGFASYTTGACLIAFGPHGPLSFSLGLTYGVVNYYVAKAIAAARGGSR